MNLDLDRQIAILKGATHDLSGNAFPFYSESDAKALELVDELAAHPLKFRLKLWCQEGKAGAELQSMAPGVIDNLPPYAEAPTRPEAICRAYIAAKTYLLEHENASP